MTFCFTGCLEIDSLYGEQLGTAGNDTLTSTSLFSVLSGLGGNDRVLGGGLFDKLDGGEGVDTLSYENACAGVTVDLRITGWQWTGGGLFDKLSGFENIIGSRFNDCLIGDAGNNRLTGGLGRDIMKGGLGNDIYSVENVGDQVIEAADEGADLVLASVDWTLGANVENLSLFNAAIRGTGNATKNLIAGNANNNILNGKGGNDTLFGGAGSDTFVFDVIGPNDWDKINDFKSGEDKIGVVGSVFGLTTGALPADYLVITSGIVARDGTHNLATTADHGQFIYDFYGNLYWDGDGSGSQAASLIAGFGAIPFAQGDIIVI